MKIWNKCVCISKKHYIILVAILVSSSILIASVYTIEEPIEDLIPLSEEKEVEVWTPTRDLDTIKADIDRILYKLERIEYADGSYDSIRYPEGGRIDKNRN